MQDCKLTSQESHMHKLLLLGIILSLTALWLLGCGGSPSGTSPILQPQTSTFAFMQSVAGQNGLYSPMIGKFVTTATSTQFSSSAFVDSASGQVVTGIFYSIAMSPDGKKGAVDMYGGLDRNSGQWDIWVANNDGSNMVQVTNDPYWDATPQFSPDGSRVIFVSQRPKEGRFEVVTRKVDGTNEQVIPMPSGFNGAWAPTYSADGGKIAMEVWGYDANNNWYDGIWIMNADGSDPQLLTNPTTNCNCHDQTPAFSANGSKLTFSRQDWNTGQEDVYVMNSDGSGVTKLSNRVGNSFEPVFFSVAGLGERILFSSNRDNVSAANGADYELYSMKVDGSDVIRLTNNNLYDSFNFSFDAPVGRTADQERNMH